MKRFLVFLMCLSLCSFAFAQSVRVTQNSFQKVAVSIAPGTLSAEDVTLPEGVFSTIALKDYGPSNNPGAPELPVLVKFLQIPVCESVVATVTNAQYTEYDAATLGITHPLYPNQPSVSKSDPQPPFAYDQTVYNTNEFYSLPLVSVEKVGVLRDMALANMYVSPVQYNPVTQKIRVYSQIDVEFTFVNANMAQTQQLQKYVSPMFSLGKNMLLNEMPNPFKAEFATSPIKYLIIANSMFSGNADLEAFANWKRRLGYIVEIAYIHDANVGSTTTSIKNYIQNKYDNPTAADPAPSFLLLIGDVEQMPSFSSQELNSHSTDLYYATLAGTDHLPDCYYGRLSATNANELKNQIDKISMYEQYTMPDPSYLGKAVLVAGTDASYGPTFANGQINYAYDNYVNETSTTHNYTTVYKHLYDCSSEAATIRSEVSAGVGWANYTAHGGQTGWSNPSFSVSDVNNLQNTNKYGLMIGNCCLTGTFDYASGPCFGEALLRAQNKGAMGYIGASQVTYWYEDVYWAVGVRSSITANMSYDASNLGMYDKLFHKSGESPDVWVSTIGGIMKGGNLSVEASSTTKKLYYWEIYHCFGDPSVRVYLGIPNTMTVNADDITLGEEQYSVEVAPYAYVALKKNTTEFVAAAFADASGIAVLDLPGNLESGTYELVALGQNYIPYFQDVEVVEEGGCLSPSNFAVNNVTAFTASASWTGESGSYNVELKEGDGDWTRLVSGTSATSYALTGLNSYTPYKVRVQSVCGTETSSWKTLSFTTLESCPRTSQLACTLTPGDGSTATLDWTENGVATTWQICINGDESNLLTVNTHPYTLTGLTPEQPYTAKVRAYCDANDQSVWSSEISFVPSDRIVIGSGSATNTFLPFHNFYNYSLTQQIYTADELGAASVIQSIGFYKNNTIECTRNLDIYMVSTNKSSFSSTTDWIPVTSNDLVFSGTVTFADNDWTDIDLTNLFNYDGVSNVAIIVDDNTGSYESSTTFLAYSASNQSLRIYSDGVDYDATAPSYTGNLETNKNQIRVLMSEPTSCMRPSGVTVNYTNGTTAVVSWNTTANTSNIKVNGNQISNVTSPYTISGLSLATNYAVQVQANCGGGDLSDWTTPVTFTTDACLPAEKCNIYFELTDSYGDTWNGAAIQVVNTATNAVLGTFTNVTNDHSSAPITETYSLPVCNGDAISFVWVSGSYNSECSYVVTDASGEEIFSGSGAMANAVDYTVNCGGPTCSRPTNLTVSNVTAHAATLSWTENGTATAWQISINGDESNLIAANTNPYTLTLNPETAYSFQVRAYCGTNDQSSWSSAVSCTTLVACPAPTDLAVALTQGNGSVATLSWTETGDASAWQICLNGDETNLISATTNPYMLNNLTADNNYTAKVRANCGGNDGTSAWSNTVNFTPTDNSVIGSGTATNNYLPSYSYYNYSLTQQIYTAEEIGTAGTINSIAFYNDGNTKTRTYDMYLVHTDKESFESTTDWITVTEADKVFTGEVEMTAGEWTVFEIDGFVYDGSSNLALIMDDNTGSYSSGMACRVFDAANMALRVYSDGTNYDPTNPGSYTGTVMNVKNQIMMDITPSTGTVCEKPATLAVDGITAHEAVLTWTEGSGTYNVEYKTSADDNWSVYANGVTGLTITMTNLTQSTAYQARVQSVCGNEVSGWKNVSFTTLEACPTPTDLTATTVPGNGTEAILSWTETGDATSWQIILNDDENNLISANTNPFTLTNLTPETAYTAQVRAYCNSVDQSNWSNTVTFEPTEKIVIGSGTATNQYIPTYTFYNYSLSQQIYTVEELGEAGVIESIDFYCTTAPCTLARAIDIYMVSTDKNSFNGATDWVTVTENDLVYSGSRLFTTGWNSFEFDNPFIYDGTQNVVLIVDDNTGSYNGTNNFRVFDATAQALRVYSDGTDYDPTNPSSYSGTVLNVKNQIRLQKSAMSDCMRPTQVVVSDITGHEATISWTENGTSTQWFLYGSEGSDEIVITVSDDPTYTLTNLVPETEYWFDLYAVCQGGQQSEPVHFSFTTDVACPAPTNLTLTNHTDGVTIGWTGTSDIYNVAIGTPSFIEAAIFDNNAIPAIFDNGSDYPWMVVAGHGGYYIKSSNAGVSSSTSEIGLTMEYPEDGVISFDAECRGEGTSSLWDHCDFYIDEERMLYAGANISGWNHYEFEVPAGNHTFTWSYTKDGSVDPSGDYFAIDNVVMTAGDIMWNDAEITMDNKHDFSISDAGWYFVHVQGDCGGEDGLSSWSEPLFFEFAPSTCGTIVLDGSNPTWSQDFEHITTITNPRWTGVTPDCWTVAEQYTGASMDGIGDQIDSLPQVYRGFNATVDGKYSLRMHFRSLLALPMLDETVDLSKVRLSMYVRQPYWSYKLQVGIITDMENPDESFVPVAVINNPNKNLTYFECGFKTVKDLVGPGRYIAFKNIGGSEGDPYCTNYLDDITLSYVDEEMCAVSLPHTWTFEGLTELSGATGIEPDCWDLIAEDAALESTTKPQVYRGFNTTSGGHYTLRMKNRCIYAMPVIEGIPSANSVDLTMTLNVRQPNELYRLQVGVLDEQDNFNVVKTIHCNGTSMEEFTVNFSNYTGGRIAFRNTLVPSTGMDVDYYDYSFNYLDDIHIDYTAVGKADGSMSEAFAADRDLENIAVYPNPTTGMLHIDAVDVQKVECYNQMGQLVRVYDNARDIDLGSLSDGVYMLRITVPQGVTMRKVVKR